MQIRYYDHVYTDVLNHLMIKTKLKGIEFVKALSRVYTNTYLICHDRENNGDVFNCEFEVYFLGKDSIISSIYSGVVKATVFISDYEKNSHEKLLRDIYVEPELSEEVTIKNELAGKLAIYDLPKEIYAFDINYCKMEIVYKPINPDYKIQYLSLKYNGKEWRKDLHFNEVSEFINVDDKLYICPFLEFYGEDKKSPYISTDFKEESIKSIKQAVNDLGISSIYYGNYKELFSFDDKYLIYTIGKEYRLILDQDVVKGNIIDKLYKNNYYRLDIKGEIEGFYSPDYDDYEYRELASYVDDPKSFCTSGFETKDDNMSITRYGDERNYFNKGNDNLVIVQMKDGRTIPMYLDEGKKSKQKLYVFQNINKQF